MNSITHGMGALLGIVALVLCVVKSALCGNVFGVVGSAIYGSTLIVLYTMGGDVVDEALSRFEVIAHRLRLVGCGSIGKYGSSGCRT